jgi:hypothetical protein
MALTPSGQVRHTLKAPYRDGTTLIVLDPQDLMARFAAVVPLPRMHLTRFHGVFAPLSRLPAAVTPAHRGMGAPKVCGMAADAAAKHAADRVSARPDCARCPRLGRGRAGIWSGGRTQVSASAHGTRVGRAMADGDRHGLTRRPIGRSSGRAKKVI